MNYTVYSIEGNRQRLDGGSMFGNAPKALWSRWTRADELNRIDLACRAFLIVDHARDRRILWEAGIGAFFEPKLRERYGVFDEGHLLLDKLAGLGYPAASIDEVVLSHLHFDHAGGLLSVWAPGVAPTLVFPRARFVVAQEAWERAQEPHLRDRVSFIPELKELLASSGRLQIVEAEAAHPSGPDFSYTLSGGHTPGQLLSELRTAKGLVIFGGDLVPGKLWLNQALSMGYDRNSELLVDEKGRLLARCRDEGAVLLFTHDAELAAATVTVDDKGRFIADKTFEALALQL